MSASNRPLRIEKATRPAEGRIKRVHVVFKTHLDLGFTDFAANIALRYRREFFPRAMQLARELREQGGSDRFIWTTGSWLVHHALAEASNSERRTLEAAIAAGDLVWHGLACTTHTELMDAQLARFSLGLAAELDRRFGKKTIAGKMTDVPGHTRGLVPLMTGAGLEFLHIGVNPASQPVDLPPIFQWRDLASGAEITVIYQGGSYGDLFLVPGGEDALFFAHTGDNLGPPTVEEVAADFSKLRARFPGSQIGASTLDAFAASLRTRRKTFPVITSEIGDTWIHGIGTDPIKTTALRALLRWRRHAGVANDAAHSAFHENLLLATEHTWGLDTKLIFGYTSSYDRHFATPEFRKRRRLPGYRRLEKSWSEQRAYLRSAVAALPEAERKAAAMAIQTTKARPVRAGVVTDPREMVTTRHFQVAFDPATGGLRGLKRAGAKRGLVSRAQPFGILFYEIFSSADYDWAWKHYNINHVQTAEWGPPDFLKPGLEKAVRRSRRWPARLRRFTQLGSRKGGVHFLAEGDFALTAAERRAFGAPARWQVEYAFPDEGPQLDLTVQWFDKPAVRLPEALWCALVPAGIKDRGCQLEKLGVLIDPADVRHHGNRRLHAAEKTFVKTADNTIQIDHFGAPLVAPGGPSLVRYQATPPDLGRGPWFNLYNNTWGTNFPMWCEDNARFQFGIDLV